MNPTETITLLIVDDHEIIRSYLRLFLESTGVYRVIDEACDGVDAVAKVPCCQPDVVIMDFSMPRLDGIEATRQIFENGASTHVIILSMYISPDQVTRAMHVGASGCVHKSSVVSEIAPAIRTVLAGKNYISPAFSMKKSRGSTQRGSSPGRRDQ